MAGTGQQWVRFASPQLASTALASTVFVALSSVLQNAFSVSAVRKFKWLGVGARTLPPFSTVPGQLGDWGGGGSIAWTEKGMQ